MARKPRFDYPGAVHHVMNRGADHQLTFRNDDDRRLFVRILVKAAARFEFEILAWCLMPNHYHLVIRSVRGNMSAAMQFIGRSYTQQFNHHHGRDGALFRGRFHSVLVDSERYLQHLSSYVHNNPVKAGLVSSENILDYRWSSLRAYAGKDLQPAWLETSSTLAFFEDRVEFLRFVQTGEIDSAVAGLYRLPHSADVVLGTDAFVARVRHLGDADSGSALTAGVDAVDLVDIDLAVCSIAGVEIGELLRGVRGRRNSARSAAVYIAHTVTRCSLEQLANWYGFSGAQTVASSVGRMNQRPASSPEWTLAQQALELLGFDWLAER